jgi:hypothetical protein
LQFVGLFITLHNQSRQKSDINLLINNFNQLSLSLNHHMLTASVISQMTREQLFTLTLLDHN